MGYQSKEQIFEKLERWLDLPENWDSYGGVAPIRETIDRVKEFISKYDVLPQGGVFPGPNGEIQLSYLRGEDEVEIFFNPKDFEEGNRMLLVYNIMSQHPLMEELPLSIEKFEEFLFN